MFTREFGEEVVGDGRTDQFRLISMERRWKEGEEKVERRWKEGEEKVKRRWKEGGDIGQDIAVH